MCAKDIRSVENPISAIFDLSEDVNNLVPTIRNMVKYASIFIIAWLFLGSVLIVGIFIQGLFAGVNLLVFIVLILLFVIGVAALSFLRRMNMFFRYYIIRHRAIKSVRDEDPVVYIPRGKTSAERVLKYLESKISEERKGERKAETVQTPAIQQGKSGVFYNFDVYVESKGSALWRILGVGNPGYAIFIKSFEKVPSIEDFKSLKRAVEDVCERTKIPPTRVIGIWKPEGEENISDDVYEFITTQTVQAGKFFTSMELIIESEDGTYDFIPFISDGAYG